MMKKTALASLLIVSLAACNKSASTKPENPTLFAEHAEVIAAIESNRLDDASATLSKAADTPDVHFLRARLAEAKLDPETAFKEIKLAVDAKPLVAEYQYELGVIAGMPGGPAQTIEAQAARFGIAGKALDDALALEPDNPKFLYTKGYYLSVADKDNGGDPGRGRKMFERVLTVAPDSAWAHRILFDRAAEAEKWDDAKKEADATGARDAVQGSRLELLLAGTYLRDGKIDEARTALEAAAALNRATANGFCDAGFALDGGHHPELGTPFWKRCLELLPDGPKSHDAKVRLEAENGSAMHDKTIRVK